MPATMQFAVTHGRDISDSQGEVATGAHSMLDFGHTPAPLGMHSIMISQHAFGYTGAQWFDQRLDVGCLFEIVFQNAHSVLQTR